MTFRDILSLSLSSMDFHSVLHIISALIIGDLTR